MATRPLRLAPANLSLAIVNLEEAARSDASYLLSQTEGLWKDGKQITMPELIRAIRRWGVWAGFNAYSDGRNLYYADLGIDYRIRPHWLIGADARLGSVDRGNSGISLAQGGVYTAFYERGWYGAAGTLLGPNQYTLYTGAGYDFHAGNWLFGPAVNLQWDDATVDNGFGRGQLFQTRAGGRVAYIGWPVSPWGQLMYQNATIDPFPHRENAVWFGTGLALPLPDGLSLYGGYSFEGNGNYQINQANLGLRLQF